MHTGNVVVLEESNQASLVFVVFCSIPSFRDCSSDLIRREKALGKEPAIFAFRKRVAERCRGEVVTEDAVKGNKKSSGLRESALKFPRKTQSETTHRGGMRRNHSIQVSENHLSDCMASDTSRICSVRREGAGKTNIN